MNLPDPSTFHPSIESAVALLTRWELRTHHWCILDGPAIRLLRPDFDATPWRDHLNVYVNEAVLPWPSRQDEMTLPPAGSKQLDELLALARAGTHLHLVPAFRYFKAGFERTVVALHSGQACSVATLRGCSQVWSYKSIELISRQVDFVGDIERIVVERLQRLTAALAAAHDQDVTDRLLLLQRGYEAFRNDRVSEAAGLFKEAAGSTWQQ